MRRSMTMNKIGTVPKLLAAGMLVTAVVLASVTQVIAARDFEQVRLNYDGTWGTPWTDPTGGGVAWTQPEGTFDIEVQVELSEDTGNTWGCTQVTIAGNTQNFPLDAPLQNEDGPEVFTEVLENVEAPAEEGEYDVSVIVRSQIGCTGGTETFTLEDALLVDDTAPVIDLLHGSEISVAQDSAFDAEDYAAVTDNMDESVGLVVTSNDVNTAAIGTYTVEYDATDIVGNTAETAVLTVHVLSAEEEAGPNGGDANDDGTQDSLQANVTSFVNPVTSNYAVLVADNADCVIDSVIIAPESANTVADNDYDYPAGLMDFTIDCGQGFSGETVTVQQYYYGDLAADNVVIRKYDPTTNSYQAIAEASTVSTEIGGFPVLVATYDITDGGPLDLDGTADGVIIDPSGPGVSLVGDSNEDLEDLLGGGSQDPSDLASTGRSVMSLYLIAGTIIPLSLFMVVRHLRNRGLSL